MTASHTPSVSIISHNIIPSPKSDNTVPLGPLDSLVTPIVPIAVVYIYQAPSAGSQEVVGIERLKRALELLLQSYPHLGGRLRLNVQNGRRTIESLGQGADFIEATVSETLSAFTKDAHQPFSLNSFPECGNELLPRFNPTEESIQQDVILTVQHTRFTCGSAALGIRILHTVVDAEGYFQVVGDLAELHRGLGETTKPLLARSPSLVSYLAEVNNGQPAKQDLATFNPSLFYVNDTQQATPDFGTAVDPESAALAVLPEGPPLAIKGRFLHFSADKLLQLKDRATDPEDKAAWVSTFIALAAHLIQRIYLARVIVGQQTGGQATLQDPNFLTPVNLRAKLGLTGRYPFNALFTPSMTFAKSDVTSKPLYKIAKQLHDLTRSADLSPASVTSTLHWMNAQSSLLDIKDHFRYSSSSVMLSQWSKFDIYTSATMDVEPLLVQNPFTAISTIDGLGYTLPSRSAEGGIVLALALDERVWKVLDQDKDFL